MRARQSFYFFITGTLKINIFSEKLQIPITLKNECQKEYSKYILGGGGGPPKWANWFLTWSKENKNFV